MPSEYITCRELIEFIADYLDGTLPAEARVEFERHLTVCPACVAYLRSYQRTIDASRDALAPSDEPATTVAPPGLVDAIRAARANART
ncbi:MAG: zf-HC2 domain-containing protein [Planctomycetota bacterium]|nr:zf-HC2 domain-containing protein [Planctomycetota bacterium]